MRLGDVLLAFVRFEFMFRKDLVVKKDLVDRCSGYCDDDDDLGEFVDFDKKNSSSEYCG